MGRKLDSYTDAEDNLVKDKDLVLLESGRIYRVEYISDHYVSLSQDGRYWLHLPFSKEIPRRLTPNKPKEVEMKLWKEMTPEEKGALLLAYHEGKVIEWCYGFSKPLTFRVDGSSDKGGMEPCWDPKCYYRVKPKPVVTEVVMIGGFDHRDSWGFDEGQLNPATHKITFNLVDGEPDCNSIKMEKL